MKLKVFIGIIFFIFLFLGEIAMTFSFKRESNRNIPSTEITPLSYKLSNDLSTNKYVKPIDSILSDFIKNKGIKGASVAIAKKGRLVFAKGFGYADEDNNVTVEPKSLFRIASVSKLITAVAIMKLREEGRIDLGSKIFGINGILNDSIYSHYKDKRVEKITVLHLLNHTAGWDGKRADPLFNSLHIAKEMGVDPPATLDQVIYYQLNQKLNYRPGKTYSYSNFGYAVLGKIIEKITGMT